MVESITPKQFHESPGVDDWRVLANGATAYFHSGSFTRGVEFIDAIRALADSANHHPDIDLRYSGVTVRLTTHEIQGLSERDASLAREISTTARDMDIPADPTVNQDLQVSIDAVDIATVRSFWRAVLNYREVGDEDLLDPRSIGPSVWFQQMETPRTERNRIHVDLFVAHDQIELRVAAALGAGGRLVSDEHAPSWWVLADPEGNEVCVACWLGRE